LRAEEDAITVDTLFTVANTSVLPGWLLLVLAPNSSWTRRIVHSLLDPAVLGSLYSVYAVMSFLGSAGSRICCWCRVSSSR